MAGPIFFIRGISTANAIIQSHTAHESRVPPPRAVASAPHRQSGNAAVNPFTILDCSSLTKTEGSVYRPIAGCRSEGGLFRDV